MEIEYQILIALLIDLAVGDPRRFPHPVRLIGRLISALERAARRGIANARTAGAATALIVILTTVLATAFLLEIARWIHPRVGDVVSILLIYTTLAARDLARHSLDVYRALERFDLPQARRFVSRMVGRDTANLTETGVVRAAVESVAENTVDGVLAPLFFAAIGGPVAAMAYKAINTLDSMIGYKDERYIDFGRFAAGMDDWANFFPARLSVPILTLAAVLLGFSASGAWRIAGRDGRRNLSPNSGLSEAAFAGALGVRLGGVMERRGIPVKQPEIGDPLVPLERKHILKANRLMFLSTIIAAALVIAARRSVALLVAG
ncbi:MAG: cobalamin biosynthesis protein [Syntrophus sp. PtaB.Bin001]|nr:MAG: cobalamin biosynthesis protein [Syntrophus sp. PtaB.Bin001]